MIDQHALPKTHDAARSTTYCDNYETKRKATNVSAHHSRGTVLSLIAALPLGIIAATGIASATDAPDDSGGTKAQFKYITKPGPGGKACGACALFQAPNACAVVKGEILATGYCSSFVPAPK